MEALRAIRRFIEIVRLVQILGQSQMRANRARYLLRAAMIFDAQRRGIPVSFLMVFLIVALDEGLASMNTPDVLA